MEVLDTGCNLHHVEGYWAAFLLLLCLVSAVFSLPPRKFQAALIFFEFSGIAWVIRVV